MKWIHLAWTRVHYHTVVNSELFKTLTIEKKGNFFIRQLLKTDSHIMTHVVYRSRQYGLHSRCYLKYLTVKHVLHS